MSAKALPLVLIAALIAPLESGAAAWMALSMGDAAAGNHLHAGLEAESKENADRQAVQHQQMHHDVSHANHQAKDSLNGHHDKDDCEEHCLSCTNHCSSLGIVSSEVDLFDLDRLLLRPEAGLTRSHSDLPYRPPIRSRGSVS